MPDLPTSPFMFEHNFYISGYVGRDMVKHTMIIPYDINNVKSRINAATVDGTDITLSGLSHLAGKYYAHVIQKLGSR